MARPKVDCADRLIPSSSAGSAAASPPWPECAAWAAGASWAAWASSTAIEPFTGGSPTT
ncbi:hypothetical protein STANM309S_04460 [Streptomyces tanashiensis]